jgi:hypothetical protein
MRELTRDVVHGKTALAITVHEETAWDTYVERVLFRNLYEHIAGKPYQAEDFMTPLVLALQDYIPMVSRTSKVVGLNGTKWPSADSDLAALAKGFEAFKVFHAYNVQLCDQAINDANKSPGNPETFPPSALTEDEKKT